MSYDNSYSQYSINICLFLCYNFLLMKRLLLSIKCWVLLCTSYPGARGSELFQGHSQQAAVLGVQPISIWLQSQRFFPLRYAYSLLLSIIIETCSLSILLLTDLNVNKTVTYHNVIETDLKSTNPRLQSQLCMSHFGNKYRKQLKWEEKMKKQEFCFILTYVF